MLLITNFVICLIGMSSMVGVDAINKHATFWLKSISPIQHITKFDCTVADNNMCYTRVLCYNALHSLDDLL